MAGDFHPHELIERAIAEQRNGCADAAESLYRAALKIDAGHPVANHNLGALIAQRGDTDASLPLLAAALKAAPQLGQYWLSYARGLLAAGRPTEAETVLIRGAQGGLSGAAFAQLKERAQLAMMHDAATPAAETIAELLDALAGNPKDARLHIRLGDLHAEQANLCEAITCYQRAIALAPDAADAHHRLGSLLSETGRIADGFAHFMRRAELLHSTHLHHNPSAPPHRLKHDAEQRNYLRSHGVLDSFHIADGSRVSGHAIEPAAATPALFEQWRRAEPKLVVIDGFLTAPALEKLRDYCARSTIWRRDYDAGYIGATPEDGFACPLLAQIAEEISSTFADIFASHRFRYLGAFKYDSTLSTGTNTHADNSAINVNFYITPDEANRDPATGGMQIWNVAAPDEATMRRLNGNEHAMRDFLAGSGAKSVKVPHRANRAVFFQSTLFHKTDDCFFEEGYLSKRINVSLLFGEPTFSPAISLTVRPSNNAA